MPGLLQTQAEHFGKTKYVMALCAEFLGSMLFAFTGSALLSVAKADPSNPNVVLAALGNAAGITIAGTTLTAFTMAGSAVQQFRCSSRPLCMLCRIETFIACCC